MSLTARMVVELRNFDAMPEGENCDEEQEDRINQILNCGKYECHWDNIAKKWVGPGAAARYEDEAIKTRLRAEIGERKKAGTWPAKGGVYDPILAQKELMVKKS
jgi:hypothetical protein